MAKGRIKYFLGLLVSPQWLCLVKLSPKTGNSIDVTHIFQRPHPRLFIARVKITISSCLIWHMHSVLCHNSLIMHCSCLSVKTHPEKIIFYTQIHPFPKELKLDQAHQLQHPAKWKTIYRWRNWEEWLRVWVGGRKSKWINRDRYKLGGRERQQETEPVTKREDSEQR